jgi:hypothetical protein
MTGKGKSKCKGKCKDGKAKAASKEMGRDAACNHRADVDV